MSNLINFFTSTSGIITVILVAIVLILLSYFISSGNQLAQQLVKVQEASSGIDVALSKRYGVLKKMFDSCKGYMDHEKYIMLESIKLRNGMSIVEKKNAATDMNNAAMAVNAVVEAYPQLATTTVFETLQKSISETEEHLQAARRLYNSNVSILNQKIVTFPISVVASLRGFEKQEMFTVEDKQRADIDMNF